MLTNNTRITVFCSKKQGRETFWFATVLDGVNYHGRDQIIVADKNVSASDEYVIRIPDSSFANYSLMLPVNIQVFTA